MERGPLRGSKSTGCRNQKLYVCLCSINYTRWNLWNALVSGCVGLRTKIILEYPRGSYKFDTSLYLPIIVTIRLLWSIWSCQLVYSKEKQREEIAWWTAQIFLFIPDNGLTVSFQRLLRELRVWSKMKHENIVPLLGLWLDYQRNASDIPSPCPIAPLMKEGSLEDYLLVRPELPTLARMTIVSTNLKSHIHSISTRLNLIVDAGYS